MSKGTDDDGCIWYFSFGANMDKHTLQKRRGVIPQESRACKVPGYGIVFDLPGIMYLEPAFASITPLKDTNLPSGVVHGVAHLITKDDYIHKIVATEGGNGHEGHGYATIDVVCEDYNGNTFTAKALSTYPQRSRSGFLPSHRYLQLLRRGAKEHNLDTTWIEYLNSLEHYQHDLKTRLGAVFSIMTALFLVVPFFILNLLMAKVFKVKTPRIFVEYMTFLTAAIWFLHDHILAPLFGSGKCNTDRKLKNA